MYTKKNRLTYRKPIVVQFLGNYVEHNPPDIVQWGSPKPRGCGPKQPITNTVLEKVLEKVQDGEACHWCSSAMLLLKENWTLLKAKFLCCVFLVLDVSPWKLVIHPCVLNKQKEIISVQLSLLGHICLLSCETNHWTLSIKYAKQIGNLEGIYLRVVWEPFK